MNEKLIVNYSVEIYTPRCDPAAVEYFARVRFSADIVPALPYLNAALARAQYFPEAAALSWRESGRTFVFHAREIDISEIANYEEAEKLAREAVDQVNRTWAMRSEITPDHSGVRRAAPMALFKRLPQTNCRECGEATCFSFALKLAAGQRALSDCPPLALPAFAGSRNALEELLP